MTEEPKPEKPKILCVDDEAAILSSLTRLLKHDFTVLTAASVSEAKDLLDRHRDIAIVLTDHSMPRESGIEFLSHVQVASPDSVRALLSGQVDVSAMVNAINSAQVHRVILKPWDNDFLRLQMIEALATHGTLREKRELERLTITDPVTLVRNHRFFQDHLRVEVERTLRHARPLSLLMIDIDHFKAFNDRFGHPAGDALLRSAAKRMSDLVRSLDTVARYGGEEFAIILPDTAFDAAMMVSERIRRSFESTPFQSLDASSTLVTVSIGVACAPQHASTPETLINAADVALYRAKGQGRNQSVGA